MWRQSEHTYTLPQLQLHSKQGTSHISWYRPAEDTSQVDRRIAVNALVLVQTSTQRNAAARAISYLWAAKAAAVRSCGASGRRRYESSQTAAPSSNVRHRGRRQRRRAIMAGRIRQPRVLLACSSPLPTQTTKNSNVFTMHGMVRRGQQLRSDAGIDTTTHHIGCRKQYRALATTTSTTSNQSCYSERALAEQG